MSDERRKLIEATGIKIMDVFQASGLNPDEIKYTLEALLKTFPTDEEIAADFLRTVRVH